MRRRSGMGRSVNLRKTPFIAPIGFAGLGKDGRFIPTDAAGLPRSRVYSQGKAEGMIVAPQVPEEEVGCANEWRMTQRGLREVPPETIDKRAATVEDVTGRSPTFRSSPRRRGKAKGESR